jgi:trehalose 6-phosphate phosphatase
VHFRNCRPDSYDEVVKAVDDIVAQQADLHVTRGRKVLEVRPKVDWDKGSALMHLVDMLGISSVGSPFVIYIGDDRTDEDAFAVLKERSLGAGILVSSKVKETKSMYTVQDPSEVRQLLQRLIEYGRSDLNEWRRRLSCTGWFLYISCYYSRK